MTTELILGMVFFGAIIALVANAILVDLKKRRTTEHSVATSASTCEGAESSNEEKCPFCHGEIESGVLKCKHCGEWLEDEHRGQVDRAQKAQIITGKVAKFIGLLVALALLSSVLIRSC